MLSGCTDDSLGVLVYLGIVMLFHRVFTLGVHITAANLDGIQFVGTNAAAQNFFSAGFGVEQPLPTLLNERDGKGPIIVANRKRGKLRIPWVYRYLVLLACLRGKLSGIILIPHRVFGR